MIKRLFESHYSSQMWTPKTESFDVTKLENLSVATISHRDKTIISYEKTFEDRMKISLHEFMAGEFSLNE